MEQSDIKLVALKELLGKKFFIPNYQRGYRWTDDQVRDLLGDIRNFAKPSNQKGFYCVQPLVVRTMSSEEKEKNNLSLNDTWYEVIDGQQRLTTLFLILTAPQLTGKVMKKSTLPSNLYEIRYQREANNEYANQSYLNCLPTQKTEPDDSCIDHYYISRARITINQWIDEAIKEDEHFKRDFCNALLNYSPEKDKEGNEVDRAHNVRFIWYETTEPDPIKVFTRLNIGKIGLTNAELIKALILNRSNFTDSEDDYIKLRQQEIAGEWDRIEYTLHNEEFWMFLNNDTDYHIPTRIDFVLDLICKKDLLEINKDDYLRIGKDKSRTFRYFYAYFQQAGETRMEGCWSKVKEYFQTFKDWFNDLEFYHYVGFLIACKSSTIDDLVKDWRDSPDRSSFLLVLKQRIKSIVTKKDVDRPYNTDGTGKRNCMAILLFHNIQTIINQNRGLKEAYGNGMFYKFPFHLFKQEGWDVEHINSNTTNDEEDLDTQKEWLVNVYPAVDNAMQKTIRESFEKGTVTECFKKVKDQYLKAQFQQQEWTPEEKNSLWNFTLLDSSTNRSYGNAIFSAKRRIIISKDNGKIMPVPLFTRDKKGIVMSESPSASSAFVPPCTKRVFLKYYSSTMGDNNYWTLDDAEAYLEDIKHCINQLDDTDYER